MTQCSGPASRRPRVSVIIPALNEGLNLPHVLAGLPRELHEVILVDGRSSDDTVDVARSGRPDIRVVAQTRRGKGNALACGFAAATGEILVMLDADGSADPHEIDAFVGALVDGADFAKGTRFAAGGSSHDITRFRRWGNGWLNRLVNVLFGAAYTDLCYGYNAFWTRLLPILDLPPLALEGAGELDLLWGDGFEIETLINIRMAEAGVRITEVGSVELVRLNGESNLHALGDGLRVLRTAIRERRLRHERAATRARVIAAEGSRERRHVVVDLPRPAGDATHRTGEDSTPMDLASGDFGARHVVGGGSAAV
jgi:glycosyltransferase involved in cell wall biosynthesis